MTLKYIDDIMASSEKEKRKYTTITIPAPLFENIKKSIEDTGFSSVSDYATYILRETTAELNSKRSGKKSEDVLLPFILLFWVCRRINVPLLPQ